MGSTLSLLTSMMPLANLPSHTVPDVSGYSIAEQLYIGSRTAVYRAVQMATQRPVVIKVLQREYPSFSELVQFRNQYTIAKNLDLPGIVQPLSLEPFGSGYALVMEDWGGVSLSQYIQRQSLSLTDVLVIALQLATILHDLHQHQVIHKDIKPANILIHPETKQVKLIDFSIASLLPKETQEIQNPNILEGTLAYLAPEQTGRMNRGIDYRADFYALGVTLYQLLSGQLPFESEDPMELVHCHMTKVPVPVDQVNPAVPTMVAAIVAKLMAKNAEDRYQSALGLKHDVQQCLTQWKERVPIADFELGQRDVSDRFLIPEKIYGRAVEVQTLLNAFERVSQGASELMLVAGFSGIGKTAVVNEVHKPITRQKGYFIKGKFDQFNRNIPLFAFVQALRDLMGQLLSESDAQLAHWKAQILAAVGENGQVLIEVIPELVQIIGQQPKAPELSGTAAQNRFNLLFQKFIQVFTTAAHPLVIFLDDLQWADSASLQLMRLLMHDNGYLLMLGAYRDNEVLPAHPLMLTIEDLKKAGIIVNTITLAPLALEHTNHLIADTLKCSGEMAQPLTQLVDRKTQGNPFFTTQFLKALHEDGYITFNRDCCYWECDIAQVNASALTDDVVEFMVLQLQKLPASTQDVLKLAACIGNQFDLATLAIVAEQAPTETAIALWKALQEGLIVPATQVYKFFQVQEIEPSDVQHSVNPVYRFLHDRVQQAAYCLIPEAKKQSVHFHIGTLLLCNSSATEQEERLFEIVSHLNVGRTFIIQPTKRDELTQLNLKAAQKAKAATAYSAAVDYLTIGIELLPPDSWHQDYNLTLALHVEMTEAQYLNTNFEQMEHWANLVLHHAQGLVDTIKVREAQLLAAQTQGQLKSALDIGLRVLHSLGINFPEQPTDEDIGTAFAVTQQLLDGRDPLSLVDLPTMAEPEHIAAIQMMTLLAPPAYLAAPTLMPLLIFKQVELALQYGNCSWSPLSYGDYGIVLTGIMGDLDAGYQFGQLTLAMLDRLQEIACKSRAEYVVNSFLKHWKEPLHDLLTPLQAAYESSLTNGDLEFVGMNAHIYCYYSYLTGKELTYLSQEMVAYGQILAQLRQELTLNWLEIDHQSVQNLLGHTTVPWQLTGSIYPSEQRLAILETNRDRTGLFHFHLNQTVLYYLFGQNALAAQEATLVEQYLDGGLAQFSIPLVSFYIALIHLALYPNAVAEEKESILKRVEVDQQKLQHWATLAPFNHQHRWQLIEAERCRVLGQIYEAGDFYDRAIASAKENGFIQDEALANELAAKFYLNWGKEKVAAGYMQEAYYCYARWGAKAKVADLEQHYPQLLQPILRQANQPLTVLETLASIATPAYSIIHSTPGKSSSSSSINQTLDFAALLQASQTLASTIELDELLRTLTQTMVENSGADHCALILCQDNQWQVGVMANLEQVTLQSAPLDDNPTVPAKLIQYVKNTLTTVVMDDLKTDLPVISDYMRQHQPKSVLCLPILNQGNLRGILYLENRSTSGVFTSDRVLILNFLCTQAAISLENARLYQQAQSYAQQLEQSQLQIVQSEKMASLGNLVAGVAHEINNPIGFLNGSINNGRDYVQDLLEHLALYQQHYPNPVAPLQDHAEDIDLEFLSEDLLKLLDAMKGATDRIKSISTSLRTFSRADTEYKVSANLHEGLDSTLLILKYRLKANQFRPAIEVIKDYGEIPSIDCFPGQLNQVFMNILANAIDMFDEMAHQLSFAELEARPQEITIRTAMVENQVQIWIRDNGKGMTEEVQAKIFDHLFTTKGVGKGTGLGLAIARQIVVDKHGGSLEVHSEPRQGTEFCIGLPIGG